MIDLNLTISVITLDVKSLDTTNFNWEIIQLYKKEKPRYILGTRNTFQISKHKYLKTKRIEKYIPC